MATYQKKLIHNQFNSPIGLYSDNNVRETLDRELQVLSNGKVGIDFAQPTTMKPGNLANSAVLRMLEEEEEFLKINGKGIKRVAWPPPPEKTPPRGSPAPVNSIPQPSSNQFRGDITKPPVTPYQHTCNEDHQQTVQTEVASVISYPVQQSFVTPNYHQDARPGDLPSPKRYGGSAFLGSGITKTVTPPVKNTSPISPSFSVGTTVTPALFSPQLHQPRSWSHVNQPVPIAPSSLSSLLPSHFTNSTLSSDPKVNLVQSEVRQDQKEENLQIITTQPPPSPVRQQSPGIIQLRKEAPISQKPSPIVTSQPAAQTFQGGLNMRGDQKWPPAEVKAQSENENEERKRIASGPAFRPRRIKKDYSTFFAKNALNPTYTSYRVPPGTQHIENTEA